MCCVCALGMQASCQIKGIQRAAWSEHQEGVSVTQAGTSLLPHLLAEAAICQGVDGGHAQRACHNVAQGHCGFGEVEVGQRGWLLGPEPFWWQFLGKAKTAADECGYRAMTTNHLCICDKSMCSGHMLAEQLRSPGMRLLKMNFSQVTPGTPVITPSGTNTCSGGRLRCGGRAPQATAHFAS